MGPNTGQWVGLNAGQINAKEWSPSWGAGLERARPGLAAGVSWLVLFSGHKKEKRGFHLPVITSFLGTYIRSRVPHSSGLD
jgi:hypothetical protein